MVAADDADAGGGDGRRSSPEPYTLSLPTSPRSTTADRTSAANAGPGSAKFRPIISAAAPAATGVAADVPLKQSGAVTVLVRQDGADISGLTRLSIVGPCDEYAAMMPKVGGSIAPTDTMLGLLESTAILLADPLAFP